MESGTIGDQSSSREGFDAFRKFYKGRSIKMAVVELQKELMVEEPLVLESLPRSNKSNSPFRYPGGKYYARRIILSELPYHTLYCEPFAGGASIFFAKEKAMQTILNDLDEDVINTLTCIRDSVEELIYLLKDIPATKELHYYYKNEFIPSSDLEQAFRWYYLNRTSYSGIMRPENCYWGFGNKYSMRPENWPPHLRTVSDKLQDVELTALDFEDVIEGLSDGWFLFVDPPYYNADQQKFYACSFGQSDHERLAECLKRNSGRLRFLLTYDDHPDIIEMYRWTEKLMHRQWNYTINRTDDQRNGKKKEDGYKSARNKGRELLIRNYGS